MAYTSSQVVQAVPTGINSALVFVASGTITNSTSVNNCFSATYTNYKVVFNNLTSGDGSGVNFRLRASGADNTGTVYSYINLGQNAQSSATMNLGIGYEYTFFSFGYGNNYANGNDFSLDFFSPNLTKNTHYGPGVFWNSQIEYCGIIAGVHRSTTSFDGFTIYPNTSTLTGTYIIYGYANS